MFLQKSRSLDNDLLIEHNWVTFEKSLRHFIIYAEVMHTLTLKKTTLQIRREKQNTLPRGGNWFVFGDLENTMVNQVMEKGNSMASFTLHIKTAISFVIYALDWDLEKS